MATARHVAAAEATEGRAAPLAGRVEWGATAAAWVVPGAAADVAAIAAMAAEPAAAKDNTA